MFLLELRAPYCKFDRQKIHKPIIFSNKTVNIRLKNEIIIAHRLQFVNYFPAKNKAFKSIFSKKSIAKLREMVYNKA